MKALYSHVSDPPSPKEKKAQQLARIESLAQVEPLIILNGYVCTEWLTRNHLLQLTAGNDRHMWTSHWSRWQSGQSTSCDVPTVTTQWPRLEVWTCCRSGWNRSGNLSSTTTTPIAKLPSLISKRSLCVHFMAAITKYADYNIRQISGSNLRVIAAPEQQWTCHFTGSES